MHKLFARGTSTTLVTDAKHLVYYSPGAAAALNAAAAVVCTARFGAAPAAVETQAEAGSLVPGEVRGADATLAAKVGPAAVAVAGAGAAAGAAAAAGLVFATVVAGVVAAVPGRAKKASQFGLLEGTAATGAGAVARTPAGACVAAAGGTATGAGAEPAVAAGGFAVATGAGGTDVGEAAGAGETTGLEATAED